MILQPWKYVSPLFAIALLCLLSACNPQSQALQSADSVDASDKAAPLGTETIAAVQLPKLQGTATVDMTVNGQQITLELDGQSAPITAGNFVDLVNRGVYDGTQFHRVVRDPKPFVVQGGDPQSKDPNFPSNRLGTGGFIDPTTQTPRNIPLEILPENADQPIYSQTLKDEQKPKLQHLRGAVAMARSPLPDSASSQFYFALSDLPFLDGDYAVFGYVTQGLDVIDKIQQGDVIESASVTQGLENLK